MGVTDEHGLPRRSAEDQLAHERIAAMKEAGMVSGYGQAEVVGKALAAGGEEYAAQVEGVMRHNEAAKEVARALEGLPDAERMASDIALMEEAQATADFAGDIAERIRRRYAEGLDEG